MSALVAEVVEIERVAPHPNADRLCIAHIKGWQCVIGKREDGAPQYEAGDLVVFVPPDSSIPREVAETLGVVSYLKERLSASHKKELVVRQVRLRGEPSFGLILSIPDGIAAVVGTDASEYFGINKFEPPPKLLFMREQCEREHPQFPQYTDVQNLRHCPNVFEEGEEVIVTEKIHGTNSRVGIVEGELMAGSRKLRRKRPSDEELAQSIYWYPTTLKSVIKMLNAGSKTDNSAIIYGEIYGRRVQKMEYGQPGLSFVAFDASANGEFLDPELFQFSCEMHSVPYAPVLYRGPYSFEKIVELSKGKSVLGGDHIREGVVVRPVAERRHPKLGRVILKYVSDEYLLGKWSADDSTDV